MSKAQLCRGQVNGSANAPQKCALSGNGVQDLRALVLQLVPMEKQNAMNAQCIDCRLNVLTACNTAPADTSSTAKTRAVLYVCIHTYKTDVNHTTVLNTAMSQPDARA